MPGRPAVCGEAAGGRAVLWSSAALQHELVDVEVARLTGQVGADLVVLSSAMSLTARQARQAARAITTAIRPHLNVLTGRPGDSLHDLLARAGHPSAAGRGPRA
jgi:hypothetical protein